MIKINQSNCYYCYDKDRVSPEFFYVVVVFKLIKNFFHLEYLSIAVSFNR